MRSDHLEASNQFPENFKGLITKFLQGKYGQKISIRSTIIQPPTAKVEIIDGKERVSFQGKVKFHVVDRRDKEFGAHRMTYVIKDNQLISLEEEP